MSSLGCGTVFLRRSLSFRSRSSSLSRSAAILAWSLRQRMQAGAAMRTSRIASSRAMPWPTSASTCRSFLTVSSGACHFILGPILGFGET